MAPPSDKLALKAARAILFRKLEEAESTLEEGLEVLPHNVLLRSLEALLRCQQGRLEEGLLLVSRYVFNFSEDSAVWWESDSCPQRRAKLEAALAEAAKQFLADAAAMTPNVVVIPGCPSEDFGAFRNTSKVLRCCGHLPLPTATGLTSRPPLLGLLKALYTARYQSTATVANGEELIEECARVGDFKGVQTTSQQLARHSNSPKHRMWGVEGMLGQLPIDPQRSEERVDRERRLYGAHTTSTGITSATAPAAMAGLQLQLVTKMLAKVLPDVVAHHHQHQHHLSHPTSSRPEQHADPNATPSSSINEGAATEPRKRETKAPTNHSKASAGGSAVAVTEEEEAAARVSTPAMAQAYVDVLLQQALWKEAVEFIASPRGGLLAFPDRRLEILSETLLTIAKRVRTASSSSSSHDTSTAVYYAALANVVGQEIWTRQPDNWTCFERYFEALDLLAEWRAGKASVAAVLASEKELSPSLVVQGVGPRRIEAHQLLVAGRITGKRSPAASIAPTMSGTVFCTSEVDVDLDAALSLARRLQAEEEALVAQNRTATKPQQRTVRLRRGPYLAELFLVHRQIQEDAQHRSERSAELQELLLQYAKTFYQTPCCYLDVSTFLTPASASAIYAWATAEREKEVEVEVEEEEPMTPEETADDHTRYLLGLRCYVAMWGEVGSPPAPAPPRRMPLLSFQPTLGEIALLMDLSARRFARSTRFSETLPWSEEGHHDGYLTAAANMALYAHYLECRPPPASWSSLPSSEPPAVWMPPTPRVVPLLAKALGWLQSAPRAEHNTAWLLLRCGLSSLLRLTDTAAIQKLSLQSVQHDSMRHLGFWAMLPGFYLRGEGGDANNAVGTVSFWSQGAHRFYQHVPRDCGEARQKVLKHFNWPVMQSIIAFEDRLERSMAFVFQPALHTVTQLLSCQTKQNVMEVIAAQREALRAAQQRLHAHPLPGCTHRCKEDIDAESGPLLDNTDWVVVKSTLLAPVKSVKAERLARLLIPMPDLPAAYASDFGAPLQNALLLLCDVAQANQLEGEEASKRRKKSKKNKASAAKEEDPSTAPSSFSTQAFLLVSPALTKASHHMGPPEDVMLPALRGIAPVLLAWLERGFVEGAHSSFSAQTAGPLTEAECQAAQSSLAQHLESIVPTHTKEPLAESRAVERFLFPSVVVLLALLHLCKGFKAYLPVSTWAATLAEALTTAQQHFKSGTWQTDEVSVSMSSSDVGSREAAALPAWQRQQREKSQRVMAFLEDAVADARAISRC